MSQTILETIGLLNELEDTIEEKPRILDDVVAASVILLCTALRQIDNGGPHGKERAKAIGISLEKMVEDEQYALEAFGFNNV